MTTKVGAATAKVAEALVGLSEEEAWEALDRASMILPRRGWLVGERTAHDGDPDEHFVAYLATLLFKHTKSQDIIAAAGRTPQLKDAPEAERRRWVELAGRYIDGVRPPWA